MNNTYSTYAEAKISNPESDIYTNGKVFGSNDALNNKSILVRKCNPSDYCITVEKFLADGHKFVDGDVVLNVFGEAEMLYGQHINSAWNYSGRLDDNNRFILRAAALDVMAQDNEAVEAKFKDYIGATGNEQMNNLLNDAQHKLVEIMDLIESSEPKNPFLEEFKSYKELLDFGIDCTTLDFEQPKTKHTKEEYVKVEYSKSWKAAKDHEELVEFLYRQSDLDDAINGNNWKAIQSPSEAAQYYFDLYRKVVTELTWKDVVLGDFALWAEDGYVGLKCDRFSEENWIEMCHAVSDAVRGADSGKFKLVEGE